MSSEVPYHPPTLDAFPEGVVTSALAKAIDRLELGMSLSDLTTRTDLFFDLDLDSIDFIEVLVSLSESLGVDVSEARGFSTVQTVGDLWDITEAWTRDYSAYEYRAWAQ